MNTICVKSEPVKSESASKKRDASPQRPKPALRKQPLRRVKQEPSPPKPKTTNRGKPYPCKICEGTLYKEDLYCPNCQHCAMCEEPKSKECDCYALKHLIRVNGRLMWNRPPHKNVRNVWNVRDLQIECTMCKHEN